MAVSTQPRPAHLPMPGGSPGASVRVHPLLTGESLAPPAFFARPDGPFPLLRGLGLTTPASKRTWVPLPAFLIEHPTAGPVLVDCGLHPSVATDPKANLGRRHALAFTERMTPEQAVPARLRALGIEPDDVAVVIMTHLHYDHVSGASEFPGATFVVSSAEWESASQRGFLHGYRHQLFDHAFDWRLVDYDAAGADAFATFGRTLDLFGDGSVRLLFTPGHSLGHQSLLVRLSQGELLLCGDAAYARRSIDEDLDPLFRDDEHLYRRSLQEIRRYVELTPTAVVICGHDAECWPRLAPVYE